MITDIFAKRYARHLHYPDIYAEWFGTFFMQAAQIFFEDIDRALGLTEPFYKDVHDRLARELGIASLVRPEGSYLQMCGTYVAHSYSYNFGEVERWAMTRLSMVELLFRGAEEKVRSLETTASKPRRGLFRRAVSIDTSEPHPARIRLSQALAELNARLRECRSRLSYHNGMLQLEQDELTSDRAAKPFWEIVAETRWSTVDLEMKEAWDRLDRGETDAPTHAFRALESTIKIISDQRGWSTGNEKGAANYVDNLRSERASRFIASWEADALTTLFRTIRNPFSHGGGSTPPDPLSEHQRRWVVETCMVWIKSLVRRP